jgi:PKD domain
MDSSSGRGRSASLAALAAIVAVMVIGVTPASAILYRTQPGHWVSYEARQGKPTPHTSPKSMRLSSASNYEIFNGSDGYLNYSGGPVMPSTNAYVFVWNGSNYAGSPFGSGSNCGFADGSGNYNTPCSSYVNGVATYFQDLAAASGTHNNSNAVSTQYNDAAGNNVDYQVTYGGTITDTDPFPNSGCTGSPSGTGGRCLTDQQVQNELQSYLASHGYPAGMTNEYFVLTPPSVASCFDPGGNVCSGNAGPGGTPYFCAYHSTTETQSHYIYSNIPDMDDITGCDPFASSSPQGNTDCDPNDFICVWPNGWADGVLSAVSHEHNESMTDPQPNNAWADWSGGPRPLGDENGDKCNFDAGDDPNAQWVQNPNDFFKGTPYNETINGRPYYIQREWSNENMGCYSSYTASAAPGATFVAHTTSGRTVSFNASGSGGGIAQYVWQFNQGPGGSQVQTVKTTSATISHTFPTAANYRVALTTMAGSGRSRGTAKTVDVKPPAISGATIQAGQTVRSIIANGFKINSHLSEAGTEKGTLQITAAKAQQLGIPRTIGTGTLAFTVAATKTMTMNLTATAKNKLKNQSNLQVTATLNATDKANNAATSVSKSTTLPH